MSPKVDMTSEDVEFCTRFPPNPYSQNYVRPFRVTSASSETSVTRNLRYTQARAEAHNDAEQRRELPRLGARTAFAAARQTTLPCAAEDPWR